MIWIHFIRKRFAFKEFFFNFCRYLFCFVFFLVLDVIFDNIVELVILQIDILLQ